MIRGDTSSESSGNDNYGASSVDGKKASSTSTGASLQSYRPYGDTLMIPRAKHSHPPSNSHSAGDAERGEAPANREHQLLDYLEGRKKGPESLSKSRASDMQSAAGRTSVSNASQFRDSLEDVEASVDRPASNMNESLARSYDETTVRPAVRRPAQYYQSDDSDNSNFDSL
jgi:hypothetical protein